MRRPIIIRFYYPRSLWGNLICFVTKSKFSHVTVEFDGIMYDASENRGNFYISSVDNSTRKYIKLVIFGDIHDWIIKNLHKEYDWVGVFGWIFGLNDRRKFYCFEAIYDMLVYLGYTKPTTEPISANTLINIILDIKD